MSNVNLADLKKQMTPTTQVLFALVIMGALLAVGLTIFFQVNKQFYYLYMFFKIFFLILFVLWFHKYLTCKVKRALNIESNENGCVVTEQNDDEPEENFFKRIVNVIFR